MEVIQRYIMRRALLVTLLILTACSPGRRHTPGAAYRDPANRVLVDLGLDGVFGPPACYRKEGFGKSSILGFIGDDQCYRFKAPERIEGIWHDEFEGSLLLTPEERAKGVWIEGQRRRWLDWKIHAPGEACRWREGCDYRIVFIGRRTLVDGAYGHLGGSQELVLLDRLISIEPWPLAKPGPEGLRTAAFPR